jgi:hypothetical protein
MAVGRKTGGGSRKGIPNKATAKRERQVAASGLTPLDFMLKTLRNAKQPYEERMRAAIAAAPYVHPKLANVQLQGDEKNPIVHTVRLIGVRADAS